MINKRVSLWKAIKREEKKYDKLFSQLIGTCSAEKKTYEILIICKFVRVLLFEKRPSTYLINLWKLFVFEYMRTLLIKAIERVGKLTWLYYELFASKLELNVKFNMND